MKSKLGIVMSISFGAISAAILLIFITILLIHTQKIPENMSSYTYAPYGYEFYYPKTMSVDSSLAAVRTKFFDKKTEISIYYDNFTGTSSNTKAYINYGNEFVKNSKEHHVTEDKIVKLSGKSVHLLKWSRDQLRHVQDDKPYYTTAEITKNNFEVYTLFIKSARPIENEMDIIKNFRITRPEGKSVIGQVGHRVPLHVDKETENVYHKLFDRAGLKWGIFEPSAPKTLEDLHALEKKLDYTFDVLVRYQSLNTNLPSDDLKKAYQNHRVVELTLQTLQYKQDNSSVMYDILRGKYDKYFTRYAKDVKAFGHPILFRLNNEMNGDWVPYSGYLNSKDAAIYIDVWKYIYTLFKQNGVDNVLWVWNPNHLSKPGFQWNHTLMYYPGDAYVDVVGLTAYNTGTFYKGEQWSSFDKLYDPLYADYKEWFDQPLMITEFASSSIGGDKLAWVNDMFAKMKKYPLLKVAIWWNHMDFDPTNKPARIYKLDETPQLVDTFRRHLSQYK